MLKLIKEGARYIAFNYLSIFLNAVRGILLISILNPTALGMCRLVFTYSSYFRYSNLGLSALAFYRAPAKRMQAVYSSLITRSNTLLALIFGIIFTIVFAFIWTRNIPGMYIDIFLCLFCILFFTQLGETFLTVARIRMQFSIVNAYTFLLASSSFVLMLGLGYLLALRGVLIGLSLALIISTFQIWRPLKNTILLPIRFTAYRVTVLFKNSTLIVLPGLILVLYTSVEVWLITFKYGVTETGYYSVVLAVTNLLLVINSDGAVFLYAKKAKEFKSDKKFILKATMVSFVALVILCTVLLMPIGWFVRVYYPDYIVSSVIYKVCFWGIPFLVARNFVMYYVSNSKTRGITAFLLLLFVIKVTVLFLLEDRASFYKGVALTNCIFGLSLLLVFHFGLLLNTGTHKRNIKKRVQAP